MSRRILFYRGKQRDFIRHVIDNTSSPSLRGLLQFGIGTNYSTLKNYYSEERTLPEDLFLQMCSLAKINSETLSFSFLSKNWGKVKGGKISKRK